jgi:hypothetical protein
MPSPAKRERAEVRVQWKSQPLPHEDVVERDKFFGEGSSLMSAKPGAI